LHNVGIRKRLKKINQSEFFHGKEENEGFCFIFLCIMHYALCKAGNMPPVLRAIDKENPDVYREISRRIPDDRDKSDSPMTSHFGVTPGSAGR